MVFSFLKKTDHYDYIKTFARLSEFSLKAAAFLDDALKNLIAEKLHDDIVALHKIEQEADRAKREMMENLIKEFLPPIDKDDIIILAHQVDNVTDAIDDVMAFVGAHNITSIPADVAVFTELILKCCFHMNLALKELENYKKSEVLYDQLRAVNRLKSEGMKLYINSLKNIYKITTDPVQIMVYTEMYKNLENCCQECKKVTNTIERIVIKNL